MTFRMDAWRRQSAVYIDRFPLLATPLVHAQVEALTLLLEKGADVDVQDEDGNTPLWVLPEGVWAREITLLPPLGGEQFPSLFAP